MSFNRQRLLFTYFFVSLILFGFVSSATTPKEEVEALKGIATALKKTNWNYSVDPCDLALSHGGWRNLNAAKGSEDAVTCNCTSAVCHVTHIYFLKWRLSSESDGGDSPLSDVGDFSSIFGGESLSNSHTVSGGCPSESDGNSEKEEDEPDLDEDEGDEDSDGNEDEDERR